MKDRIAKLSRKKPPLKNKAKKRAAVIDPTLSFRFPTISAAKDFCISSRSDLVHVDNESQFLCSRGARLDGSKQYHCGGRKSYGCETTRVCYGRHVVQFGQCTHDTWTSSRLRLLYGQLEFLNSSVTGSVTAASLMVRPECSKLGLTLSQISSFLRNRNRQQAFSAEEFDSWLKVYSRTSTAGFFIKFKQGEGDVWAILVSHPKLVGIKFEAEDTANLDGNARHLMVKSGGTMLLIGNLALHSL